MFLSSSVNDPFGISSISQSYPCQSFPIVIFSPINLNGNLPEKGDRGKERTEGVRDKVRHVVNQLPRRHRGCEGNVEGLGFIRFDVEWDDGGGREGS